MPALLPTDPVEYRRRRWVARIATTLIAVPAALCVLAMTLILVRGGDTRAGMIVYVEFIVLCALGWFVLVPLWRRARAARPVTLRADAGWGERRGVPELDAPPRPHRGLSGEEEPPKRW